MSDVITVAEATPSSDLPWRKIVTTFEDDDDSEQIEFNAETSIGTYSIGFSVWLEGGYAIAFKGARKRDKWFSICLFCPTVEMAMEIAAFHHAKSTTAK
jgi:hypothetical protein